MKKNVILICMAVCLLFACLCNPIPHEAFAEEFDGYEIVPIRLDSNIVGARMYGAFFGESNIAVYVDVYFSEDIKYDFANNDVLNPQNARLNSLFGRINNVLDEVERAADVLLAGSDVANFNELVCGQSTEISRCGYQMLTIAKQLYFATDGNYNPLLFRAVDLWGFSSRFTNGTYLQHPQPYDRVFDYQASSYPLPSDELVEAFCNQDFTNFDSGVVLNQDGDRYYVTKNVPSVTVGGAEYQAWLDLGGVAKGYACDCIAQLIEGEGITDYIVNVGGSSVACGNGFNGTTHNISVTDPFDQTAVLGKVELLCKTLATSGTYQRRYVTDGQEFSHIISTDGRPINNGIKSITVICDGRLAAYADCLATALAVGGKDYIVDFVNGDAALSNGVQVVAVYQTLDGTKQLLSTANAMRECDGCTLNEYAVSLVKADGKYEYVNAKAPTSANVSTIVLVIICAAVVVLIAVNVAFKAKMRDVNKKIDIIVLKADEPFKRADAVLYLIICVLICALLVVPFDSEEITSVVATDEVSGQDIFVYNVSQNKWQTYPLEDWTVSVQENGLTLVVTFTAEDGAFNVLKICRDGDVTVKMVDSRCGFCQDCVRAFSPLTKIGRAIVCVPNGLKIVTK